MKGLMMKMSNTKSGILALAVAGLMLAGITDCSAQKKAAQKANKVTGQLPLAAKATKKAARKARANMTKAAIIKVEDVIKDLRDPQTKELGNAIAQALRALDIKMSFVQKKSARKGGGKKKNTNKKAQRQQKRADRKAAKGADTEEE